MVRKQKTPEHLHCVDVYQLYRLLFLSMEMGVAFNALSRYSDYGERCRKNYDADAQ